MQTRKSAVLILLAVAILLGGCGSLKVDVKNGPMTVEGSDTTNIMVLPHQSLGVQITPALLKGDVTVYNVPLPDCIMGEMYPGRIRFNGWVVDGSEEFFAQFVQEGLFSSGELMYAMIVESKRKLSASAKVLELNSTGQFASNLSDDNKIYPVVRDKFKTDKEHRIEFVRQYGSRIGNRSENLDFIKRVKKWNIYSFEGEGKIFSPYGADDIKRIKRINPAYTPLEKMIDDGFATLATDPVYTVASIAITVIEGMNAPSKGWDYSATVADRWVLGSFASFIGKLRIALIVELNAEIEKIKADRDELKSENIRLRNELMQ